MISIILQISSFDNVSHDAKPSRISHNSIISWQDLLYRSISAGSLVELYQPDCLYLNANHGEVNYIYMTNIYSFLEKKIYFIQRNKSA